MVKGGRRREERSGEERSGEEKRGEERRGATDCVRDRPDRDIRTALS
jgi:hypothetical protein